MISERFQNRAIELFERAKEIAAMKCGGSLMLETITDYGFEFESTQYKCSCCGPDTEYVYVSWEEISDPDIRATIEKEKQQKLEAERKRKEQERLQYEKQKQDEKRKMYEKLKKEFGE